MAYCHLHNVNLSSECGRFDTVCGQCECEMAEDTDRQAWLALSPQQKHQIYEDIWEIQKKRLYCAHMIRKGDCIVCYPESEIQF